MGRRAPLVIGVAAGFVFAATLTVIAQPIQDVEAKAQRIFTSVMRLRAVPPPQRWGLLLWVAPALALAVSLAALTRFVTRRSGGVVPTSEGLATDPAMADRLQRELDEEM